MAKKLSTTYIFVDDTGAFSIDGAVVTSLPNTYIASAVDKYIIKRAPGDTGTLSGSVTMSSTNIENGIYYEFEFEDTFVLGGHTFSIFGQAITAAQLLSKPTVVVRDDYTTFQVYINNNGSGENIDTVNIVDEAVTLAKMGDLPQGAFIVGDSSNRPAQVDGSASGRIPIGDGSDLSMKSVSGDATLASTGVLTVANDAIDNNKLANIARGSVKVGGAANAPTDLDISAAAAFLLGDGTDVNAVVMSGDATLNSSAVLTIANDAVDNNKLANISEGFIKVGGAANAPTDLDNSAAGAMVLGNGTGVSSQVMTGAGTLSSLGVFALATNAVTTSTILADNVTIDKVTDSLKYTTERVEVSFETGEQGDFDVYMSGSGTIVSYRAFAVSAIAGTDDGTITAKNNGGAAMASGVITYTASDPRGTTYEVTPSTNNTFVDGDKITFTTAKVTAGGKVILAIKVLKS